MRRIKEFIYYRLFYRLKEILFLSLAIWLVFLFSAFAAEVEDEISGNTKEFFTKEFSLMTGFAQGDLENKDDYKIAPLIFRFGYNLNTIEMGITDLAQPLFDKLGIKPRGYTEFILEPFVNTVIGPDSNIEAGCSILLKFAYPLVDNFHLYGIAGGGVLYMSQHTHEQSTQYNFIPQVGGGFSYFIKEDCAFNIEYRYRHLSNAGLEDPNDGINVDMVLTGITWFY